MIYIYCSICYYRRIDFAKKTIPKMIELEPSEIIFGIDDVLDLKIPYANQTTIHHIDTSKLN